MKKLSFVLAAAGLMTLAACGEKTPVENTSDAVENVAENATDVIENIADNASDAIENVSENATEAVDNAM